MVVKWCIAQLTYDALTIMWDDLTILWNDLTWNDLTMQRNDRIPSYLLLKVGNLRRSKIMTGKRLALKCLKKRLGKT